MKDYLLPVGSVVSLKDAEKKIMIIGTDVVQEDDDTEYDYIAVPFPEGYVDSEMMFLVMHESIEQVHFLGYVNAETQLYRAQIKNN